MSAHADLLFFGHISDPANRDMSKDQTACFHDGSNADIWCVLLQSSRWHRHVKASQDSSSREYIWRVYSSMPWECRVLGHNTLQCFAIQAPGQVGLVYRGKYCQSPKLSKTRDMYSKHCSTAQRNSQGKRACNSAGCLRYMMSSQPHQ